MGSCEQSEVIESNSIRNPDYFDSNESPRNECCFLNGHHLKNTHFSRVNFTQYKHLPHLPA